MEGEMTKIKEEVRKFREEIEELIKEGEAMRVEAERIVREVKSIIEDVFCIKLEETKEEETEEEKKFEGEYKEAIIVLRLFEDEIKRAIFNKKERNFEIKIGEFSMDIGKVVLHKELEIFLNGFKIGVLGVSFTV